MGFMTEISILNDGWDQIYDNPGEFVEKLSPIVSGGGLRLDERNTFGVGNHGNCVTVGAVHHADDPRIYIAQRNSFEDLNSFRIRRRIEERPELLDYYRNLVKQVQTEMRWIKTSTIDMK